MYKILSKLTNVTIGYLENLELSSNKLIAKPKKFKKLDKQKYQVIYEEDIIVFQTPLEAVEVYWNKELLLEDEKNNKRYVGKVIKVEKEMISLILKEYSDKRRFLRIPIDKEMVLTSGRGQKIENIYALVDNLSYGGFGFIASDNLEHGIEVILKIHLQTAVSLKGKIVHKTDSDDSFDFY